ncbi:MAG: tol-pal system protein YbgF [Rickettsia sp.]|nr:tol-pal system protein YbgF [Rickettsia sp.]
MIFNITRIVFIIFCIQHAVWANEFDVLRDGGASFENDSFSQEIPNSELQQEQEIHTEILNKILERLDNIENLLREMQESYVVQNDKLYDQELYKKQEDEPEIDLAFSTEAQYDIALRLLKSKKYLDAENAFSEFITNNPESTLLGQAWFWYAETFYQRKIYNKALIAYLKSYKKFPSSAKAPDSLLRSALILGNMNKKIDACRLLDKLDEKFPNKTSELIEITKDMRKKFTCNQNKE